MASLFCTDYSGRCFHYCKCNNSSKTILWTELLGDTDSLTYSVRNIQNNHPLWGSVFQSPFHSLSYINICVYASSHNVCSTHQIIPMFTDFSILKQLEVMILHQFTTSQIVAFLPQFLFTYRHMHLNLHIQNLCLVHFEMLIYYHCTRPTLQICWRISRFVNLSTKLGLQSGTAQHISLAVWFPWKDLISRYHLLWQCGHCLWVMYLRLWELFDSVMTSWFSFDHGDFPVFQNVHLWTHQMVPW